MSTTKLEKIKKIEVLLTYYGGNKAQLARAIGITQTMVRDILTGKSGLGAKTLEGLSKIGINLDWLLAGKGEMWVETGKGQPHSQSQAEQPARGQAAGDNKVQIPIVPFYAGAGGTGIGSEEEGQEFMTLNADWLAQTVRVKPHNLVLVPVRGDSMEPTLMSGSIVMIDRSHATITDDGVYLLRVGEGVLVKRVEVLIEGGVFIKSDNPVYSTQKIEEESQERLDVLGKVVWMMKPM